ncbi:hypothetical protein PQY66_00075 [Luminiphilus sp.]|nr:hypothetical protein [Luminiphilus sp.]
MKVLSYMVSLFCLYLVVQGWSVLWSIHFMLPIAIIATMLFLAMLLIVTAEDRKKARADRIFEEMCDQYEEEESDK